MVVIILPKKSKEIIKTVTKNNTLESELQIEAVKTISTTLLLKVKTKPSKQNNQIRVSEVIAADLFTENLFDFPKDSCNSQIK